MKQVFKSLGNKADVAILAGIFYWTQGKTDMWNFLRSFLSDSEMHEYVDKHVQALPDYETK